MRIRLSGRRKTITGDNGPQIESYIKGLQEWQHFYNWDLAHGSLGGLSPMDKYFLVSEKTPFWDEVESYCDDSKEQFQEQNYRTLLLK